jgi:hypothetical protein
MECGKIDHEPDVAFAGEAPSIAKTVIVQKKYLNKRDVVFIH